MPPSANPPSRCWWVERKKPHLNGPAADVLIITRCPQPHETEVKSAARGRRRPRPPLRTTAASASTWCPARPVAALRALLFRHL